MDVLDTQPSVTPAEMPRSSTISVLVLMGVFAVIFSYLIAYAGANALASADVKIVGRSVSWRRRASDSDPVTAVRRICFVARSDRGAPAADLV